MSWRLLKALWRAHFAILIEYRATVFLWILAGVTPLVMMFVWMEISGGDVIGTRAPVDFARYFMIAFVVAQTTQAWAVWELDYMIRSGSFSTLLVKPLDPWWDQLVENISGNGFRLPLVALIALLGLWLTGAFAGIDPWRFLLFVPSLLLANQIAFNLSYVLALLALWTERIKSVDVWNYVALAVLGGQVFPLDLLSPSMATLVALTPYPSIIAFPIATLAEPLSASQAMRGLATQGLWLAIFVAIHRVLWRLGLKRFGAVGG